MSYWRSALGGKNLLQWEQVLPFGSGLYFERAVLSWKAYRKSHGLFPFVERIENYGNVSMPIKGLVETGIYKTGILLLLPCCTDTYTPFFKVLTHFEKCKYCKIVWISCFSCDCRMSVQLGR